jgi:hypothetical protein
LEQDIETEEKFMQSTVTFETVLTLVKQLSPTDQFRLLEWLVGQLKALFTFTSPTNKQTTQPTIAELEKRYVEGYQRYPQQPDEVDIWLDEQVWE